MKESKFYQEIQEEACIEQGRADVLQVLGLRFGSEAVAKFQKPLQAIVDPNQLTQLNAVAVTCRRPADFRRALTTVSAQKA